MKDGNFYKGLTMSCDILEGDKGACFFCNTTMTAFGPMFDDGEQAEAFEAWLYFNPRSYTHRVLCHKHAQWMREK